MSSEQFLNISQAAKATGKSIPTIRNYLAAKKLPNAKATKRGKTKTWLIPVTDLVMAGLLDQVTAPRATDTAPTELMELREQLAGLRAENFQLRERLAEAHQARADLIAAYAGRIETAEKQAQRRSLWGLFK